MSEDIPKTYTIKCRCCGGLGKYTPEYDKSIVLIQRFIDADINILDKLIDESVESLQIKKSKQSHTKRLLRKFCDLVNDCKYVIRTK